MTDEVGGTLVHVDPASRETTSTTLGGRPEGVTLADGSLWIAVQAAGAAHRGGTLRMLAEPSDDSIDPARNYSRSWQLLSVVYDGLVGFKRVGGADGNTLVPDLASALPTPTDNGRTYTFRLRKGIRFSDGRELKASAVRYSFERLFRASRRGPTSTRASSAARACRKHPAAMRPLEGRRDRRRHGDRHDQAARAGPRVSLQAGAAVRGRRPDRHTPPGETPVPGTGPYRIAEYSPKRAHPARPQSPLQGVVEGGSAGRHPGRDRARRGEAPPTRR